MSFDFAIELLEISDISKVAIQDIPSIEKKAKKRWHPDRVTHLNDPKITKEYTGKFQRIEEACQLIAAFLQGTYHAGEAFTQTCKTVYEEPEEIIRKNARNIQQTLRELWSIIRERKYKWEEKEVVLSDGFKLKDMLSEDFKEDIAMLSVVSFFYGLVSLGLLTAIGSLINPTLGVIVSIIWAVQALSCIIGFLPLSRFWFPHAGQDIIFRFINFGLGIYHWAEEQGQNSTKPWVLLLVRIPVLFAKLIKYVLLFPLYELAKAIVGHKVLGIVKKKVNYYADAADWYIEQLINNNPDQMTRDELFHLSYIYSELSDVKANTNDNSRHTSYSATSEKPPQDKGQNGTEKATGTYTNATPKQQVSENKFAGIAIACILVIGLSLGIYFLFFNKSSKATELVQGDILLSVPGKYPQGSQRILTVEELESMNQYDLKILRNEIYARHGLLFTNEEMKQYFNLQDWYKPQYAEVNTYLTEIEKKNAMLLKRIEKAKTEAENNISANEPVPLTTNPTKNASEKFVYAGPCYIIVTASYVNENDAINAMEKMKSAGNANAGYLWIPDYPSLSGKQFYTTFLGPFTSREECAANLHSLQKKNKSLYGVKVSTETGREEIH